MSNPIFQPHNFDSMVRLVVGDCNGIKGQERWEKETPIFVDAISRLASPEVKVVLDYGCGVGRLAKGMLTARPDIEVIGVDDSPKQLTAALAYVNDERFETLLPTELNRPVDLVYCIYVLQHMPAIELREALQRIHYFLKPGGLFIHCASEYRMAVRFDRPQFFDDRFLGVTISREVARFFEPQAPLFDTEIIEREEILQRIILGKGGEAPEMHVPHPAFVYKRREIEGPLFNVPLR